MKTEARGTVGTPFPWARRDARFSPGPESAAWMHRGAVLLALVWSLIPVLWLLYTALRPEAEVFAHPLRYAPRGLTAENFAAAWGTPHFPRSLANSLLIAGGASLLATCAGALTAFAGVLRPSATAFRLQGAAWVLAVLPPAVFVIPLYQQMRWAGLLDTRIGLALIHAAFNLPLTIFLCRQGARAIPREILEAARLDGFRFGGLLRRVMAPLAAPSVATAALLAFLFSWNEYFLALVLTHSPETRPVAVGLTLMSGASVYEMPWPRMLAGLALAVAPAVLALVFFQRPIVAGLSDGAVKG